MTGKKTEFTGIRKEVSSGPSHKRAPAVAAEMSGKIDFEIVLVLSCSDGRGGLLSVLLGRKWKGNYCYCVAVT